MQLMSDPHVIALDNTKMTYRLAPAAPSAHCCSPSSFHVFIALHGLTQTHVLGEFLSG